MSSKISGRNAVETKSLSELPYKSLKELSDRLDQLRDGKTAYWRELAKEMDYTSIMIENFGLSANKPNGSPGYSLLLDMSNRGVTYDQLITMLKRIHLYDALANLGHKEDVRIVKQPTSTPVMVGQRLELVCEAEGIPRPKYLWFKGQKPLTDQRVSKLVIENITLEHGGVYTCRAENEANFIFSQWVEVQVQSPITKKGPVPCGAMNPDTPKIVEHPQAQVLEVGNKLFLTCQAQGVGPLNYQWFRNGEALIYGTKQDLVINEVQMADQGVYVCCVKTSNGSSALTKGAEIVVNMNAFIHSPQYPQQQQQQNVIPPPPHHSQDMLRDGGHRELSDFQHGPPFPGPPGRYSIDPRPPPPPPQQQQGQRLLQDPGPFDPIHMMGGAVSPMMSPSNGMPDHIQHPFPLNNPGPPTIHHSVRPDHNVIPPQEGRGDPSINPSSSLEPQGQGIECGPMGQDYSIIDRPCSDKVALLIGNKDYRVKTLKLNTPENDTQDLAGILRSADFKVVSLVNLTKKEMEDAVKYFTQLIGPNVYSLFFFAGHGFELNNMNYMMAVDCTKEKNPKYCVCAQMVLRMMQEKGAKLSIVLLDMCRVAAPQIPITDMSEVYENPYPARSYPGFHIFGFSCSPAEKAYEVAAGSGDSLETQDQLGLVGKDNSIFVAALKEHLQAERGSLKDTVQTLFNATAKSVHKHKPVGAESQWQRPEISSNLAEDLSLDDPIDPTLLPQQKDKRSKRWKDAHTIPDTTVVSTAYGHLALRLNFRAEHTNVLIVQADVLQGCLTETEVEKMDMQLILQERPVPWILASAMPDSPSSPHMAVQKSIAKKNLLHFKIPDLQKITTSEVTLRINASYRWRDTHSEKCNWQFQSDEINYRMAPPLYGKITTHEEELRLKQQIQHQQQQQQQQPPLPPPPPGGPHPHYIPPGPLLHYSMTH